MKQQTAIEWVIEQLPIIQHGGLRDVFNQAKAMEKEQIIKSYKDHHDLGHIYGLDGEDYYNDTYNTKQ